MYILKYTYSYTFRNTTLYVLDFENKTQNRIVLNFYNKNILMDCVYIVEMFIPNEILTCFTIFY